MSPSLRVRESIKLKRRLVMFYEVRILDSNNYIKKIITTKELSRMHWIKFEKTQSQLVVPKLKKKNQSN